MIEQLKLYALGFLALLTGILAFLLQNANLKAKTKQIKSIQKVTKIQMDVNKILANRNITEVLDRVEKEIRDSDTSSLDD